MSSYHPHFADEQVKHRGNSAKETQLVGAWWSRANWHNPCTFLPKVTREWDCGEGRVLTCRRLVPGWASCRSAAGWTRSGGSCPRRRWWWRWAGLPRGGCWSQARAPAPPSSQRVGSRPSVTGFLSVWAPGPSWGCLWAFSRPSARRAPDPTAAMSPESSPQPDRRAAHFRRGCFTSRRGRAAVASVWRLTGRESRRGGPAKPSLWVSWGQRSSSLEVSRPYGLVSRSQ